MVFHPPTSMDRSKFSSNCPGELVRISPQAGGWAFVPAPLPPQWKLSDSLWPQLNEATMQIGILEGLGRNLPNPALLLRPLGNREAIQSSRIEGTYAIRPLVTICCGSLKLGS